MHLTWKGFAGELPRIEPHLLPPNAAQLAQNVKLWTGACEALKSPLYITDLAKPGEKKTIYRYGQSVDSDTQFWFHWTVDVDVCRGPLMDDTQERLYISGDGPLKATDATMGTSGANLPSSAYLVGLPAPTKPTATVSGAATGVAARIVVGYQFVNSWGEPGPISPVSDPVDYYPGQTLEVSFMDGAPSGAYNVPNKRIYVSQTDSSENTALRYWKEIPVATTTTSGTVDFTLLGEAVESPSMIAPPADLFNVMLHPNRFLVGFTKRRICRSEANRPYGWPEVYRDPVGDDIVGGAIFGQSIVVCTKGLTWLATGQDPLNQAIIDLAGRQPCVAKRTIKAMPFGVLYASPDGLVLVASSGPLVVISEGILTRAQWQALKPESMHAAVHDKRYYVWYDTGSVKGGLIFEFDAGGAINTLTRTDIHVTAAYSDHRRDDLFVAMPADGHLYKWDAGAAATQVWRSGEVRFDRPQAVGAAKVLAKAYPVVFRFYADGALIDTVTVADGMPFTLTGGDRRARFHVEHAGVNTVTQMDVASSIFDLRR